jgi:uncharacterized membrane protein YccC
MTVTTRRPLSGLSWEWLEISARTTLAAVGSLLLARFLKLPEAYWAPITAVVVMQSSLGATLKVSGRRLAGTALGAAAGAVISRCFGVSVLTFAAAVFVLGLLSGVLRVDRSAYRFAGITASVVMLIPHGDPPWVIALYRFTESSLGIVVGLLVTVVWPERVSGSSLRTSRS